MDKTYRDTQAIRSSHLDGKQCVSRRSIDKRWIPQYENELQEVALYAEMRKEQMHTLSSDFKESGTLRRFWDAKVPRKHTTFYNFFSFEVTNTVEVLKEIQKYIDFYDEMGNLVTEICSFKVNNGGDCGNERSTNIPFQSRVLELGKRANELFRKAEKAKENTGSTQICDLHSSFIEQHEALGKMLKDTENVALKRDLTRATKGWMESKREINKITKKVNDLEEKFNVLKNHF